MNFFVIEGLDGSGKSTQIEMLQGYLKEKKIKYKYLHFPRTGKSLYGELIARFLRGELGRIDQVDPYLVALIYAGDRKDAADTVTGWIKEGNFVILDRYVHSNIAFQCAKIKDISERIKLKEWINNLEYEYNKIPKPDLSLFLDVPFNFTKSKLTIERSGDDREYLKGQKDIHEENLDFQKRVKDVYLWQVEEDTNFKPVNCINEKDEMLKPGQIFKKIIHYINNH